MLNTCKSNEKLSFGMVESGERVSNAWAIYPWVGDNPSKGGLIPHIQYCHKTLLKILREPEEELTFYQLVGRVMAYQGYDG